MSKVLFVACLLLVGILGSVEGLGVNWGTIATHPLPPEIVVQLLKDNGINKVKLFGNDPTILKALANTGIEVMVAIANDQMAPLSKPENAEAWVKANITAFTSKGTNIKLVGVGNEPFLKDYKDTLVNVTFPALKSIQTALNDAGVGKSIKATVPLNADVYFSPDYNPVPSAGVFRGDIAKEVVKIAEFLNENNAPFMINVYPFLSLFYGKGKFPVDFAFFDGGASPLKDNGAEYTNVFDANYDTCVSALKGAGFGNLTIMIGEIGWPTEGDSFANVTMASRFYTGLVKHLASDKGTPLKPGYIEVYMFGLLDEEAKSILPGTFERSWGIFTFDGRPKFPLDLSGSGKNKTLVAAKNVTYLPKKWCVMNPNPKNANVSKLAETVEYACDFADCMPTTNGSSCGSLDDTGKASYAFNSYFQNQYQQKEACDFSGLATLATQDPSKGTCNFTIGLAPSMKDTLSPAPAPAPLDSSSPGKGSPDGAAGSGNPSAAKSAAGPSLARPSSVVMMALAIFSLVTLKLWM